MSKYLPVTLTVNDPGGARFTATAEVSSMGGVLVTGDTDLCEIESITDGEYSVEWLTEHLRDLGAEAWKQWAEQNGDDR